MDVPKVINLARNAKEKGEDFFSFNGLEQINSLDKFDRIKALTEIVKVFDVDVNSISVMNALINKFEWLDFQIAEEIKKRVNQ